MTAPPSPPPSSSPQSSGPPPLPASSGRAPRRAVSAKERASSGRRSRGSGRIWLLGVVLLFGAVSGWGAFYRSRAQNETLEERMGRIVVRDRVEQTRADRQRAKWIRQHVQMASGADKIRRARWAPLSEEQQAAAAESGLPVKFENALRMRFVLIPAGTFIMGSPGYEEGRGDDEEMHNVVLSKPFYMLTTEVSISLYSRFDESMRKKGSFGMGQPDVRGRPIMQVSHERATAFCRWLEERDAERTYALPTEAQWEYACRAGTAEAFWWGQDASLAGAFANVADQALREGLGRSEREALEAQEGWGWFDTDDGTVGVAPVGSFRANPWGLYDMLGNVREWCADWHGRYGPDGLSDPEGPGGGERRVLRGGSSDSSVRETRSASRSAAWRQGEINIDVGFRVVSTPRR